ncbi:MAG: hypothetical protein NTV24_02695 [Candidatus Woesebacteria bacterium]|nr:hypothetical protein [Candidatus Woesebacteria bacterium]
MHAYLIIGNSEEGITYSKKLATKLKAKTLEFPLNKIADTRELKNVTKLTFNTPTAILINSIDEATEEAVNAFLKNLEEPQENIYYILTASNLKNVLPTIISRCEVIKVQSTQYIVHSEESEKFFKFTTGEKLALIDKIKDRGEAKIFVQNLIEVLHFNLLNLTKNKLKRVLDLEILIKTLNNLKLKFIVQFIFYLI